MSYMQLVAFRNSEAELDEEYRNSWGGAAMVWTALVQKYQLSDGSRNPFDEWQNLFDAAKDGRLKLNPYELLVLEWTYDNALVRREHLGEMADALEMFKDAHATPNKVCHLGAVASRMRELTKDESVEAVGLYAMSVSENPWQEEGEDGTIPYSLKTGTKHWFLEP